MLRKTSNHAVKSTVLSSVGLLSLVAGLAVAVPALATTSGDDALEAATRVEGEDLNLDAPNVDDAEEGATAPQDPDIDLDEDQGTVEEHQDSTGNEESAEVSVAEAKANLGCAIPQGVFTGTIPNGVHRISGANRYQTSAEIANTVASKPTGTGSAVFVASGTEFADGLALGALAAKSGWPLVLTPAGSLTDSARATIANVAPDHVYIAGGTGAITEATEAAVIEASGRASEDVSVMRFAGKDRYETSAKIAECFEPGSAVFLTTGDNFADAVVAGAPAGKNGGAVVLTPRNKLGAHASNALKHLKPRNVEIVGGSWSSAQQAEIKNVAGASALKVHSGKNRYETSAKVANAFYGTGKKPIVFTNGSDFPDALSGISVATVANAPILLTKPSCRPKQIESVANTASQKILLGGEKAVSNASADKTCVPPPPKPKAPAKTLVTVAQQQVGKGYVLGASGPNVFDCSGLTQYVYRQNGINIPRTSYEQLSRGTRVASPRPGDIVVLNGGGHVGIYIVPGIMVDAGNPRVGVSQRAIYAPPTAYVRFG